MTSQSTITPFLYGGGAWLILTTLAVVCLWYRATRPTTPTDEHCARVDAELTRAEHAARVARGHDRAPAARAVVERDAVVIEFPRRLRLVQGGLDELGDEVAVSCWPVDGEGPVAA